ncbi:MAG: hypothetical protein LUE92_12465 [Clostridiales bacterium]|nr:hypothetical protein [Clostridiales bacterium]
METQAEDMLYTVTEVGENGELIKDMRVVKKQYSPEELAVIDGEIEKYRLVVNYTEKKEDYSRPEALEQWDAKNDIPFRRANAVVKDGHLIGAVVETHHVSGSYSYYSNKTGKRLSPWAGQRILIAITRTATSLTTANTGIHI